MKKLLAVLLGLMLGTSVWAQKPASGAITAEYLLDLSQLGLFTPGSGSPYSLVNQSARLRYFFNDDMALRVHLGFNGNKETQDFAENQDGTGNTGTRTASYNMITFGVGVEKHFAGTERLSPFVGFQIMFTGTSASEEWNNYDGTGYATDYTRTITNAATVNNSNYVAGSTFGVGAYVGFDYYFTDALYLGTEFGLGFSSTSNKDVTTETKVGTNTTTTVTLGGKSGGLYTTALGNIRFGFILKGE